MEIRKEDLITKEKVEKFKIAINYLENLFNIKINVFNCLNCKVFFIMVINDNKRYCPKCKSYDIKEIDINDYIKRD